MAAISTAGSGNWSSTTPNAPWPGGTLPTAADDVTIANTHTVTLDVTTAVAKSVTIAAGGTLTPITSANSKIIVENSISVASSSTAFLNWDMSGAAAHISEIYCNNVNATGAGYGIDIQGKYTLKGANRKRGTYTQSALVANTTTSVVVDDATGWRVGDRLCFATTQAYNATPRIDLVTIATLTPGSGTTATITWIDGVGTGGAVLYQHDTQCLVGNLSSNLIVGPATADNVFFVRSRCGANGGGAVVKDVRFQSGAPSSTFGVTGQMALDGSNSGVAEVGNNAFFNFSGSCALYFRSNNSEYVRDSNLFYSEKVTSVVSITANIKQPLGTESNPIILRAATGFNTLAPGTPIVGPLISACDVPVNPGGFDLEIIGGGIWSCKRVNNSADNNTATTTTYTGTAIGQGPSAGKYTGANNANVGYFGGSGSFEMYDCPLNTAGGSLFSESGASLTNAAVSTYAAFYGKDANPAVQEVYRNVSNTVPVISREATVTNRSTSAIKFEITGTANRQFTQTFRVLAKSGQAIRIIGYYRKNASYGASTLPSVTISGLGITPVSSTMSGGTAADAWEKFDLSATQNSGADGELTVTLAAQSATSGAVAYFSGVPFAPFISRARHYGYLFDETSPTRTTDTVTSAAEATAAAYLGMSVAWGASQSNITVSDNNTFQKLYDYHQSQAVLNVGSALALTGAGVAGSPSLFAAGNVTVSTTKVLNGSGSLSMGTKTLTAELNTGGAYTYTGGTYSRLTTGDTFNGGTLNIGAAGTYAFSLTSAIISMTPAAPSTYAMGGATFSGTVDLRNTAAHAITVELPSGTSYTTANNTGGVITVSSPPISQGLEFTGVVAGSTVKVFDTGTTTELFSATAAPYTFSQTRVTDITVDYTILKDGYIPIRVGGVLLQSAVLATPIQQVVDRAYSASAGLTYGTTATANTGTKQFGVTVATTLQNWYSFMVESWRTQAALKNVAFPLSANGPNSFTLASGWVWDGAPSIALLSRDGMRYLNASGNVTAMWAALLSVGVPAGKQVRYQQADGTGTTNAANTGDIDQLIQILSDPNGDGNYADGYDKRAWLVLKVQADGYDQAESNAVATYGNLEDQLYVVGLAPTANGIAAQAGITGLTLTDHGASPVTWNGKVFSLTITDTTDTHSGAQILQWVRDANAFNNHDLVQKNGAKFKSVRGSVYGDTGAALKGVRVVKADGTTGHPDFDLFTADDGTTYATPLYQTITISGAVAGSRVQLYDTTSSTELYNGTPAFPYTWTDSVAAAANRAIRLRVAKQSTVTAKQFVEANIGTCGTTSGTKDLSYLVSQSDDASYNTNGIDGGTVTGITITPSPTDRVKINIAGGSVTYPSIYAYQVYWLATATGIADEAAFITSPDTANYLFSGFDIRNDSATPLVITGGYGRDAATGLVKDIIDVAGSLGNIYAAPDHAIPYSSGSGLTAGQAASLAAAEAQSSAAALAAVEVKKIVRNKHIIDRATGIETIYDDSGVVLYTRAVKVDEAGLIPYDGTAAPHRVERFE